MTMAELSHSRDAAGGWARRMARTAALGWTGRTVRRLIEGSIGELSWAAEGLTYRYTAFERKAVVTQDLRPTKDLPARTGAE
jgi:hypothetical protein